MRRTIRFMIVFLFLVAGSLRAADGIVLEKAFATKGKPMAVSFASDHPTDLTLQVIYRPNSETKKKWVAGAFDGNGTLMWTPTEPGLATLTVMNKGGESLASLEVGVCFSEIPVLGIVVMLFAGLLLFGGSGLSLVMALRRID